jgi:hypothetical protein
MPITKEEIQAFCAENAIPIGYQYTLVMASEVKRVLMENIPTEYRLKFLEHLDRMVDRAWLTAEMIEAVEPMCDKAYEIALEAKKLPGGKFLDVYAQNFSTFALLNPSLIEALRMLPTRIGRAEHRPVLIGVEGSC